MSDLREYLGMVDSFMQDKRHADLKYKTYEGLVLAEGTSLTGEVRIEPNGEVRECFKNSAHLAMDKGYQYVEGYAMAMMPVLHAWCLDGDTVVETTWPDEGTEYLGLVIPLRYVYEVTIKTGYWGVIANDWMNDAELLKRGLDATREEEPTNH